MESEKAMKQRQEQYRDGQYQKQLKFDQAMIMLIMTFTFSFTAYIFYTLFWSSVSLQSTIYKVVMVYRP